MARFSIIKLVAALSLSVFVSSAPAPGTTTIESRQASSYWLASIARQGVVAYGASPSYKVFRNVKDYGAKGDGMSTT